MRNCYLSRDYKEINGAGNKAKTDMEAIMSDMGFVNVGFRQTRYKNVVLAFLITFSGIVKAAFSLKKGDLLFLQYPLKKYFTLICKVAHLRGARVAVLIHDLGSFRRKKLSVPQEIKRIGHADYVIALNPTMREWLKDNHCALPIGSLGIWDYLSETHCPSSVQFPDTCKVVYAGALNRRKNSFLYQWGNYIKNYRVSLYGGGLDVASMENARCFDIKGFVLSEQLIASADGHFGLVWDGDSVRTCSGSFGEYLQFNNPHKTSLYIRCGLPVIIWEKAALAPFIVQNGIGFCISSLEELDEKLRLVTPEQYTQMRNNVLRMSGLLEQGHFFRQAAREAVRTLRGFAGSVSEQIPQP